VLAQQACSTSNQKTRSSFLSEAVSIRSSNQKQFLVMGYLREIKRRERV
jgi:hypothetical protein